MASIRPDSRPAMRDVALLAAERAIESGALMMLRPGRASVQELIAKGERDYATAVDLEIERTIRRVLSEAAPSIPVLGEEEGGASVHDDLFWALDPIDGTVNFSKGSPLCAISLALIEAGRPTLGLLDAPLLREHYVAREGAGASLNGRPIAVRRVEHLEQAMVGMSDFAVGDLAAEENPIHLEIVRRLAGASLRTRVHGSASLDLAWLAAGRLDATAMLSNKLWDVAAGVLLVREAGGSVFDHDGSPYSVDSRFTIGATPPIAAELQAVVAAAVAAAEPSAGR